MKIAGIYDSILFRCGIQVLCSEVDQLRLSDVAKYSLFLDPFLAFYSITL